MVDLAMLISISVGNRVNPEAGISITANLGAIRSHESGEVRRTPRVLEVVERAAVEPPKLR